MDSKKAQAFYLTSSLLLLISPYVLLKLASFFQDLSSHTFRTMPWMGFLFTVSLVLPVIMVLHIYSYQRIRHAHKKLIELCLSASFVIAATLSFFSVIFILSIFDHFTLVCCFFFSFTLLTAFLFGNRPDKIA